MTVPVDVTLYYDVVCPWCLLGLQSWTDTAKDMSDTVSLTFRLEPFVLNGDIQSPGVPVGRYLQERGYGHAVRQDIWKRQISEGAALGLTMRSSDDHMLLPSIPGHLAVIAAAAQDAGFKMAMAVLSANFEEGLRIDQPDVLIRLAKDLDLDVAKFEADCASEATLRALQMSVQQAINQGVNSVPSCQIGGGFLQPGFHRPDQLRSILARFAAPMSEAVQ